MKSLRKTFESKIRTRINIIGPPNSGKSTLVTRLVKQGIFQNQSLHNDNENISFPTEILCKGPRENNVKLLIEFKSKDDIINELKYYILNFIDEAFLELMMKAELNTIDDINNMENDFYKLFVELIKNNYGIKLKHYFNANSLKQVFSHINFYDVYKDLNTSIYEENLKIRDNNIWNKHFRIFIQEISNTYDKWRNKIEKYYIFTSYDEENLYENQFSYDSEIFFNNELNAIINIIYNSDYNCALMINRVFIEAPSKENEYSDIVFIDYTNSKIDCNIVQDIEYRISQDYKEVFLIIVPCNNISYLSKIKKDINKVTLEKRIFCILNNFNDYKTEIEKNNDMSHNIITTLKNRVIKDLNIPNDKIIVTEKFNDIDKNTLLKLNSNSDLTRLLKIIKSNKFIKTIKVTHPFDSNIISIRLNRERMSVQALMNMLYDRYNGYLIDLWNNIIDITSIYKNNNSKYYYNVTRSIIRNRKNNFRNYKYNINDFNNNINEVIDFSFRSGENNDAKKILDMLLNYGYHTIGFNSNENKIIIKVNGEISREDKLSLIQSIKGRLEESAITYFENAFFDMIAEEKFQNINLEDALNNETNINLNDFYKVFEEIFNTMSKNIERYELLIE